MFDLNLQNKERSYIQLFEKRYYRDTNPVVFYLGFSLTILLVSVIPSLVLMGLNYVSKFSSKLVDFEFITMLFIYSTIVVVGTLFITIIIGYIKLKLTGNSKPFFEYKYENTDNLNISIKFYPTLF